MANVNLPQFIPSPLPLLGTPVGSAKSSNPSAEEIAAHPNMYMVNGVWYSKNDPSAPDPFGETPMTKAIDTAHYKAVGLLPPDITDMPALPKDPVIPTAAALPILSSITPATPGVRMNEDIRQDRATRFRTIGGA